MRLDHWPPPWVARGRRAPRCPGCNHRSRMWPLHDRDLYVCRWGHGVTGQEAHEARRAGRAPVAIDLTRCSWL